VEPVQAFARVMGHRVLALDEALFAVAAVLRPPVDVIDQLTRLDQLAAECPTPTADGVMRFLFQGDDAFQGDTSTYTDPQNSLLNRVLDRRRGIPITLSVLAMEVARRVGVTLVGVGMPAHFLVGEASHPLERPQRWFDCFAGGRAMDESGCQALYQRVSGGDTRFDTQWLGAVTPREIVVRVLNNVKASAQRRDDVRLLRDVMRLRAVIPELALAEYDELARLMAPFN